VSDAAPVLDTLAGPAAAGDLDVMTFNVRYASTAEPNPWTRRRAVVRALLRAERPHLIGTQEGLAGQIRDLGMDLGPRWGFVGLGRDGGARGEFTAIFYDGTRLSPQCHGHFWLSDTPDVVGSNTWGARIVRMATWARFLDLTTGRSFHAVNTHLDHISDYARQRSAVLIRDRLAAFDPALPVVLTGDFNAAARPGSAVYDLLVTSIGYVDTWTRAGIRGAGYGTCHGYGPVAPGGDRIDWILTTPDITTVAASMNTYRSGEQFPSDHLPVQARLRMPEGG
jgi:endonuclease/exonuclease/phosphatase family metal-dependent hydrolase